MFHIGAIFVIDFAGEGFKPDAGESFESAHCFQFKKTTLGGGGGGGDPFLFSA